MDNGAYLQYKATQSSLPKPLPVEPAPMPALSTVEIAVIAVIAILAIYAVYHIIRDLVKSSQQNKS